MEKREGFRVEAASLLKDFNENLSLHLRTLRVINVYDLFGFSRSFWTDAATAFSEKR